MYMIKILYDKNISGPHTKLEILKLERKSNLISFNYFTFVSDVHCHKQNFSITSGFQCTGKII